ncbi:MAG: heavy-metal-associated domain-containing protein [Actinomycetia bacterium]|nr:heavy-metal-associated domain-containing protein [Actinomycetes bacterium]
MVRTATYVVVGAEKMHCEGCAARVGQALQRIGGVRTVTANHQTQVIEVTFDPAEATEATIRVRLEALGYEVVPPAP